MNRSEALGALAGSPVAHLATIRPDLRPHVVPVTFALTRNAIVTMIDHKPKTTTRLQRLVNIEANSQASVLVDSYSEDWARLWWVRVDGQAAIHDRDSVWSSARDALVDKYSQYRKRPPEGPAIVVSIDHVSSWSSTP